MQLIEGRVARCEDKVLDLVAKAKPKALADVGYVEERSVRAIKKLELALGEQAPGPQVAQRRVGGLLDQPLGDQGIGGLDVALPQQHRDLEPPRREALGHRRVRPLHGVIGVVAGRTTGIAQQLGGRLAVEAAAIGVCGRGMPGGLVAHAAFALLTAGSSGIGEMAAA